MFSGFATITAGEFYSILTIFAGMLLGFYGVAKLMLKQATKDRESDRKERQDLALAIKQMAKSSERVAQVTETGMGKVAAATERGSAEAEQRNGHLAELIMQQGEMVKEVAKGTAQTIIDKVSNIDNQSVHTQVIDQAVIHKKGK